MKKIIFLSFMCIPLLISGCTSQSSYSETLGDLEYYENRVYELESEVEDLEYQVSELETCINEMEYAISEAKYNIEEGYIEDAYYNLDEYFSCL